jgi:MFS family permease
MEAPGVSQDDGVSDRKVTYTEVFAIGEYRALFAGTQLSWIGLYMARAVVMVVVFVETNSIAMAAAAFALSYAPWILGGPLLATLAERLPYRSVMWVSDLLRAVLVALVALPGMPLPWMLLLVFTVAMLSPPAQAARSATMPLVLTGERVVLGIAINAAGAQTTQVLGYLTGALIAALSPQSALLINAGAFLLAAVVTRLGVQHRPPAMREEDRTTLIRETGEGFRMVFATPALRTIAIIVFASMLFAILPEGLAIGWADELAAGEESRRGLYQGLIMVANPLGVALGGLLISRLLAPSVRRRLVPIFAVLGPLSLVPALAQPGIIGVVAMATIAGLAMAGMAPTLNGMFVQILRHGYRARAFGVMNSGMQVIQGLAVLVAGLMTEFFPLHIVVGFWSVAGVILMSILAWRWPKLAYFNSAIAESKVVNQELEEASERLAAARQTTVPARHALAPTRPAPVPAGQAPANAQQPAGNAPHAHADAGQPTADRATEVPAQRGTSAADSR